MSRNYKGDFSRQKDTGKRRSDRPEGRVSNKEVRRQTAADDLTEQDLAMDENTSKIEGRNAVIEAFRAGKAVDKVFILDGCQDGPVSTIRREAKAHGALIKFVTK